MLNSPVFSSFPEPPDPWEERGMSAEMPTDSLRHSPRRFPLDPSHEIVAASPPDGILPCAGDPTVVQIPTHPHEPTSCGAAMLLEEEMKVDATQAQQLWDHIQDCLALLWWEGPTDELPIGW